MYILVSCQYIIILNLGLINHIMKAKIKKILKITGWLIVSGFLVIQFIRPTRNSGNIHGKNHIKHVVNVPQNVESILVKTCYDCHSNNTNYPWYTNIQPVGWWMQNHVDEGKEELNFSEFKTYKLKRQRHKLHECEEMIEENEMPLDSYLWIHSEAKLTEKEKQILINWVDESMNSLPKFGE